MSLKIAAATIALAFSLSAPSSQAAELQLSARAADLLGQYLAQQGNAALLQIRTELRNELNDAIRPLLPDPQIQPDPEPRADSAAESAAAR